MKPRKPKKLSLTVPSIVRQYCCVGCKDVLPDEEITAYVYKWYGTDRTSIVFKRKNRNIGRLELHWMELFGSFRELLENLQYLTLEMRLNDWGVMDLRNLSVKRVF